MKKANNLLAIIQTIAITATISWFLYTHPYQNLIVDESQTTTTTVNGVEYTFSKDGSSLNIYPNDENHKTNSTDPYDENEIYSPKPGETYSMLGIDIKVIGVKEDKYVLTVTPSVKK